MQQMLRENQIGFAVYQVETKEGAFFLMAFIVSTTVLMQISSSLLMMMEE